jgi:hypothetical protein
LQDGPGLRSGGVVGVVGGDDWSWGRCGCADGDSDGGGEDGTEDEGVGGEDAVVDDELDVGVGAQSSDGGVFLVGVGGGFEDSDGEGIIVADDACSTETGAGPGVRGYSAVAVGDEITVRDGRADGAGELLSVRAKAGGEDEDGEKEEFAKKQGRPQGADCGVRCGVVEWESDDAPRKTAATVCGSLADRCIGDFSGWARGRGRAETLPLCAVLGGYDGRSAVVEERR